MRKSFTNIAIAIAIIGFSTTSIAGTFIKGNCTWGVATVKGVPVTNKKGVVTDYSLPWDGNAKDWCKTAKKYTTVDKNETIGAIVVFDGPNTDYGHVGIITGSGEMKSMNDMKGLGLWDYNRKVSGFPNKKKPRIPTCYIHYKEKQI